MKKVLKLTVSILTLLSCLSSSALAREIPIAKVWDINMPIGEMIIMEFPFKVTSVRPTPFLSKKTKTESGAIDNMGDMGLQLPPPSRDLNASNIGVKQQVNSATAGTKPAPTGGENKSSLSIKKGENSLELFAKNAGEVELAIWGYDHPMMIKITFSEVAKEEREKYYKFVDLSQKKEDATTFEQNGHEEIISKLTIALHNGKTPKGYKKVGVNQKISYSDFGIDANLVYVLLGNKYAGEYWDITNTRKDTLSLHEEMFYDKGVFSISFPNNQIPPGKTVQMLLVRNNTTSNK